MPTLTLIRHAKAAWPAGVDDFERPLAERGLADCQVAKNLFADSFFELALISAARRTQETADALSLNYQHRINSADIYEAGLGSLLHVLNQRSVEHLVMIGHSPGMPMLAWHLAGNKESTAAQKLRLKYPTLGIAKLVSDLPFAQWHSECAELRSFEVPRFDVENLGSD